MAEDDKQRRTPSWPGWPRRNGQPKPRDKPKSVWNSLEAAKLAAALATPLLVGWLSLEVRHVDNARARHQREAGDRITRELYDAEQRQVRAFRAADIRRASDLDAAKNAREDDIRAQDARRIVEARGEEVARMERLRVEEAGRNARAENESKYKEGMRAAGEFTRFLLSYQLELQAISKVLPVRRDDEKLVFNSEAARSELSKYEKLDSEWGVSVTAHLLGLRRLLPQDAYEDLRASVTDGFYETAFKGADECLTQALDEPGSVADSAYWSSCNTLKADDLVETRGCIADLATELYRVVADTFRSATPSGDEPAEDPDDPHFPYCGIG